MTRFERLFSSVWGLAIIYLVFLGTYLGASDGRLRHHSAYNHYVYLADGWLHGRLDLAASPPNENDWARVEVLHLKDGRTLKGQFRTVGPTDRFYPLRGPSLTVDKDEIVSRSWIRYVSFPPLPGVLMLPFVAIWHLAFNDVLFTVLWAAFNPVLLFLLLRSLQRRGYSKRSVADDLWLTVMLGAGSVYFYSSVLGQVWYTAHVIAVTCVIGYAWAAIEASRPGLAGLFIGLGFATRPELGFMFPLFFFEAVRMTGGWKRLRELFKQGVPTGLLGRCLRFSLSAGAILAVILTHNFLRFGNPAVFGHEYLNIAWQDRIQKWGLVNIHFLSRNLACALVLLPRVLAQYPYVKVGAHGMSLLVTSPNLVYTVAPAERSPLARGLWITILLTALPSLLYQNSGYIQFGYRFSLDYMVFLIMLLSVGNRRLTWLWKALLVWAVAVNLFGAITFDHWTQFSYDDSFFPHGNN
jgi:hypothetical protein